MFHPLFWIISIFCFFIFFLIFIIGFSIFHLFTFLLGIIAFLLFFFFVLGIDILSHLKGFIQYSLGDFWQPEEQDQPSPIPEITIAEQVFNIPSNIFNYEDARALCSAYGARLATYNEIEDAYEKGGEWCNYGWSENQQILFPTQKDTYDKLQGIKGHENDCGRQGINGGYIANPHARFGVNCYGHKPKITTTEQQMMDNANSPYPLSAEDIVLQKKVDFFKANLNNILISPFNSSYWSKLI